MKSLKLKRRCIGVSIAKIAFFDPNVFVLYSVRTERMADQHYQRVTSFAKEMLVRPEEIMVHKIKNEQFANELKPAVVLPSITSSHPRKGHHAANSYSVDFSGRLNASKF